MAEKLQNILHEVEREITGKRDFPPRIGMDTRLVIYVPSTKDKSEKISGSAVKERVNVVREYVTKKLGGTTTVAGYGTYTSADGRVIGEGVTKILAFVKYSDWLKHDQDFEKWLHMKKEEWGQETIGFEFESPEDHASTLHFV